MSTNYKAISFNIPAATENFQGLTSSTPAVHWMQSGCGGRIVALAFAYPGATGEYSNFPGNAHVTVDLLDKNGDTVCTAASSAAHNFVGILMGLKLAPGKPAGNDTDTGYVQGQGFINSNFKMYSLDQNNFSSGTIVVTMRGKLAGSSLTIDGVTNYGSSDDASLLNNATKPGDQNYTNLSFSEIDVNGNGVYQLSIPFSVVEGTF